MKPSACYSLICVIIMRLDIYADMRTDDPQNEQKRG